MSSRKISRKKSDGIGFKFLIVSLLIIMFVIFLIGLQIGMVVEKTSREGEVNKVVTKTFVEDDVGERIRGEIEKMRESPVVMEREGRKTESKKPEEVYHEVVKEPEEVLKQPEKVVPEGDKKGKTTRSAVKGTTKEKLFLQVGVFSSSKNAENMRNKLEKNGMKVKVEIFKKKNGMLFRRVIVGPFLNPDAAKKGETKIRNLTGIKPILVKREG